MTVAAVLALASPEGAKGRDLPDQLVDRAAHRRSAHLRRGAAGSRAASSGSAMASRASECRCWSRCCCATSARSCRRSRLRRRSSGATIPLAVPLLLAGEVGASRSHRGTGHLVHHRRRQPVLDQWRAGARQRPGCRPDVFYKQILKYSALVVAIGPLIAWAVLVAARLALTAHWHVDARGRTTAGVRAATATGRHP